MGYVIAAIVVVLIVGAFIFLLVNRATGKSNVSDAPDPGADQNPLARTAGGPDDPNVARPVVGGEAEGERST